MKRVLRGSSHASLPALIRGSEFKVMFPRHILRSEAAFTYAGEPVVVTLLGEDKQAARLENRAGGLRATDTHPRVLSRAAFLL